MIYDDLSLMQKNFCTLNKIGEEECVTFFDSLGNREPVFNDFNAEQKSICFLNKLNNTQCLTYWVGDNQGTQPGTLPFTPYENLHQEQKDYCSLNGLGNDECVEFFEGNANYNSLTESQKEYCTLQSLGRGECVYLFMVKNNNTEEVLGKEVEDSIKNQNNNIIYFDDTAYNNSLLQTKNIKQQPVISYSVLNTSQDILNVSKKLTQDLGTSFREFTKTEPDLANVSLSQSYQRTQWITLNSKDKQDAPIKEIFVDFEANNGIYRINSSGDFRTVYVSAIVYVVGWNQSFTAYRKYQKTVTFSGSSKQPLRRSAVFNVEPGYYQIQVLRNAPNSYHSARTSNDFNLKRVVSVFDMSSQYKDVTLIGIKLKSHEQFSQSTALSVNALVRKKSKIKNSYFPYQLTLRDFIIDIWTNKKEGIGEDINKLDIRVDLQENCNLVLDQQEVSLSVISDILKGFGYVFYPSQSGYVIDKIGVKQERNYVFHEGNYKKITFNYNIPQKLEAGDGVRVKYLPQGQIDLVEYVYPENALNPSEIILKGVSISEIAKKTAKRIHRENTKRGKQCTIETDLEGMIPELNSRVGVSSKYLKDTITAKIDNVEYFTEDEIVKTKIFLSDKIQFLPKYTACMFLTSNLNGSVKHNIKTSSDFINYVIIEDYVEVKNDEKIITIGFQDEFIEDFIVEAITASQDEFGNITGVKVDMIEYNPYIYLED